MNEVFIASDIEKLMLTYDTLHEFPAGQTNDDIRLSLKNVLPTDIPQLELNLMSLPELTSENVIKLQKNEMFCNNIILNIDCSKHDNYFIDATGILHEKVIYLAVYFQP